MAMTLIDEMYVSFKPDEIEGFMDRLGVVPDEQYRVIGSLGDKLMVVVGKNIIEVYPRKLIVERIVA